MQNQKIHLIPVSRELGAGGPARVSSAVLVAQAAQLATTGRNTMHEATTLVEAMVR